MSVTTHWNRVSKQMVQMFGPQWTEKFGTKNEAWEDGLSGLSYAEVSAGLSKVRNGALKFYEIDLPNFFGLCRPSPPPRRLEEASVPDYLIGVSEEEAYCHQFANKKMLKFAFPHMPLPVAVQKRMWATARKLSKDFGAMRKELGIENVPDDDFLKALQRQWARDIDQK